MSESKPNDTLTERARREGWSEEPFFTDQANSQYYVHVPKGERLKKLMYRVYDPVATATWPTKDVTTLQSLETFFADQQGEVLEREVEKLMEDHKVSTKPVRTREWIDKVTQHQPVGETRELKPAAHTFVALSEEYDWRDLKITIAEGAVRYGMAKDRNPDPTVPVKVDDFPHSLPSFKFTGGRKDLTPFSLEYTTRVGEDDCRRVEVGLLSEAQDQDGDDKTYLWYRDLGVHKDPWKEEVFALIPPTEAIDQAAQKEHIEALQARSLGTGDDDDTATVPVPGKWIPLGSHLDSTSPLLQVMDEIKEHLETPGPHKGHTHTD